MQSQWLLPGLVLALFALVTAVLGAYPRRPRRFSLVLIALFGLYALWVMLSAAWASSLDSVWDEAGRTLLYLIALSSPLPSSPTPGRVTRPGTCCWPPRSRWWRSRSIGSTERAPPWADWSSCSWKAASRTRPATPTTPRRSTWSSSGPSCGWPPTPTSGHRFAAFRWLVCWGLAALAVLTQSRGSFWATVLTLIFLFILSPARLRTLVFLLVPAALVVWGFSDLNSYWRLGPEQMTGGVAVRVILLGMTVAAVVGFTLALLEHWVVVSRRMRMVFGAVVLVAVASSAIYGSVLFERQVGDPGRWLSDSWSRFTADMPTVLPGSGSTDSQGESAASSRFLVFSTSGRWDIWRVAWEDFRDSPVLGLGAGNYVFSYDREGQRETRGPQQPHSWELRVLSETGAEEAYSLRESSFWESP